MSLEYNEEEEKGDDSIAGAKVISFDTELNLTEEEKARLIFHSFANLINVLLDAVGKCRVALNMVDDGVFEETLRIVTEIGKSLSSISNTIALLFKLPILKTKIVQEIDQAKKTFTEYEQKQMAISGSSFTPISKAFWKDIRWIENNLLPIVEIRTKELTQRLTLPGDAWVMYKTETLRKNMETVLLAVAKGTIMVSGIVFREEDRKVATDMLVDLEFRGVQEGSIHLPPVFQDVMRDLIMNARKYSLPGATIKARMINDGTKLMIEVKDNGLGIEESEITHIIEYGVRGSNVAHRRTLGGGFGLTKAYFFTKQFNGTFTVASGIGVGSTFTLLIPCPSSFRLMLPAGTHPHTSVIDKTNARSASAEVKRKDIPVEKSAFASTPKDNQMERRRAMNQKHSSSATSSATPSSSTHMPSSPLSTSYT
ncbi:putative histidine kinase [Monocercomonoides exilis]|uniref:putative histidine kinase n=1 Tax=Monocercomonoides exilis TaxID=2049356 RepID=UPI00355A0FD0|nr:putative histidine kinase [Monocercomonoides exilis]|eukprot:MONOS_13603.1-p1 / transcript=MONOS_13603.1 / gene=MONOS_13603 / organism=Monocercomonoides_exilis_PA203 / gene_product=histidine kinase / transcript_product=histidine kinase / location=Mono_scaffold00852:14094-15618(+) / protein_length=425 / sequence_SO=supercontig / SO=protein_coding / is_pseudo=false